MNIGVILIIFCLLSFSVWTIISETKSLNNENSENDENDKFEKSKGKIRSIDSLFYGIVLLIIAIFLIYNQI
jgi:Na+/H+ antiporter NhaC